MDFSGQLQKLKSSHWAGVEIISTPDERGRPQPHAVIPWDKVPMWLVTIHAGKVAPEIRPKLVRYQAEAADVLSRHFLRTPGKPRRIPGRSTLTRSR